MVLTLTSKIFDLMAPEQESCMHTFIQEQSDWKDIIFIVLDKKYFSPERGQYCHLRSTILCSPPPGLFNYSMKKPCNFIEVSDDTWI